jgi:hypothetical protein
MNSLAWFEPCPSAHCRGVRVCARRNTEWLNRKGGQRRMNWEKFNQMNRLFPLPSFGCGSAATSPLWIT